MTLKIGDIVRNKLNRADVGTVDRINLGPGMRDLILIRFHRNGVPSGDGLCVPINQLELVEK